MPGKETQPVPPRSQEGKAVGVPPENPRAQERVAEVVRNGGRKLAEQIVEEQQHQRGVRHEGQSEAGGIRLRAHDRRVMILNMIRIEAIQLQRLAADALRQLNVLDTVQVMEVRELTDGMWMVGFEDRSPQTRFPGFEIGIQQDWSPKHASAELRVELRDKLWICPLCQRRALIRRIVDREVFRIECELCGRFEIDAELLDELRRALEDGTPSILERLARLSMHVKQGAGMPHLSTANWVALTAGLPYNRTP